MGKGTQQLFSIITASFCLLQENQRLAKDYSDMKARLAVREADNLKLEDLLDRLQEEKKRLTQRNNKLTANG